MPKTNKAPEGISQDAWDGWSTSQRALAAERISAKQKKSDEESSKLYAKRQKDKEDREKRRQENNAKLPATPENKADTEAMHLNRLRANVKYREQLQTEADAEIAARNSADSKLWRDSLLNSQAGLNNMVGGNAQSAALLAPVDSAVGMGGRGMAESASINNEALAKDMSKGYKANLELFEAKQDLGSTNTAKEAAGAFGHLLDASVEKAGELILPWPLNKIIPKSDSEAKAGEALSAFIKTANMEDLSKELNVSKETLKFLGNNPKFAVPYLASEAAEEIPEIGLGVVSRGAGPIAKKLISGTGTVIGALNDTGQTAKGIEDTLLRERAEGKNNLTDDEILKETRVAAATSFIWNAINPAEQLPKKMAAGKGGGILSVATAVPSGAVGEIGDAVIQNLATGHSLLEGTGFSAAIGAVADPSVGAGVGIVEKTLTTLADIGKDTTPKTPGQSGNESLVKAGFVVNPKLEEAANMGASFVSGDSNESIRSVEASMVRPSEISQETKLGSVSDSDYLEQASIVPTKTASGEVPKASSSFNSAQSQIIDKLYRDSVKAGTAGLMPSEAVYDSNGFARRRSDASIVRMAKNAGLSEEEAQHKLAELKSLESIAKDKDLNTEAINRTENVEGIENSLKLPSTDQKEFKPLRKMISRVRRQIASDGSLRSPKDQMERNIGITQGDSNLIASLDLRSAYTTGKALKEENAPKTEVLGTLVDALDSEDPKELIMALEEAKGFFDGSDDSQLDSLIAEALGVHRELKAKKVASKTSDELKIERKTKVTSKWEARKLRMRMTSIKDRPNIVDPSSEQHSQELADKATGLKNFVEKEMLKHPENLSEEAIKSLTKKHASTFLKQFSDKDIQESISSIVNKLVVSIASIEGSDYSSKDSETVKHSKKRRDYLKKVMKSGGSSYKIVKGGLSTEERLKEIKGVIQDVKRRLSSDVALAFAKGWSTDKSKLAFEVIDNLVITLTEITASRLIVANIEGPIKGLIVGGVATEGAHIVVAEPIAFIHEITHFAGSDSRIGKEVIIEDAKELARSIIDLLTNPKSSSLNHQDLSAIMGNIYGHYVYNSRLQRGETEEVAGRSRLREVGAVFSEAALTGESMSPETLIYFMEAIPELKEVLDSSALSDMSSIEKERLMKRAIEVSKQVPFNTDMIMKVAVALTESASRYLDADDKMLAAVFDTDIHESLVRIPKTAANNELMPSNKEQEDMDMASRIAYAATVDSESDYSLQDLLYALQASIDKHTSTKAIANPKPPTAKSLNSLYAALTSAEDTEDTEKAKEARKEVRTIVSSIKPILERIREARLNETLKLSSKKLHRIFDRAVPKEAYVSSNARVNMQQVGKIALIHGEDFDVKNLTVSEKLHLKNLKPERIARILSDLRTQLLNGLRDDLNNKTMAYTSIPDLVDKLLNPMSMAFAVQDLAQLPRDDWQRVNTALDSFIDSSGVTRETRMAAMFAKLYVTSLIYRTPLEDVGTDKENLGTGARVVTDVASKTNDTLVTSIAKALSIPLQLPSIKKSLDIIVKDLVKYRLPSRELESKNPTHMVTMDFEVTTEHGSLGGSSSVNSYVATKEYLSREKVLAVSFTSVDLSNPEAPPVTTIIIMDTPENRIKALKKVRKHAENDILVAHNQLFESVVMAEFFTDSNGNPLIPTYPILDTSTMNRDVNPGSSLSLADAVETAGVGKKGEDIVDFMGKSFEAIMADEELVQRMGNYAGNDTIIASALALHLAPSYSAILSNSAMAGVNASNKDLKRVLEYSGSAIFSIIPSHMNSSGKLVAIPENRVSKLKDKAIHFIRTAVIEEYPGGVSPTLFNPIRGTTVSGLRGPLAKGQYDSHAMAIYNSLRAAMAALVTSTVNSEIFNSAVNYLQYTSEVLGDSKFDLLMDTIRVAESAEANILDDMSPDSEDSTYWQSIFRDTSSDVQRVNEEVLSTLRSSEEIDIRSINAHENASLMGITLKLFRGMGITINSNLKPLPITYHSILNKTSDGVLSINSFLKGEGLTTPLYTPAGRVAVGASNWGSKHSFVQQSDLKLEQIEGSSREVTQEQEDSFFEDLKKSAKDTVEVTTRITIYRFVRQAIQEVRNLPDPIRKSLADNGITYADVAMAMLKASVSKNAASVTAMKQLKEYFVTQDADKGPYAAFGSNTLVNALGVPSDLTLENQITPQGLEVPNKVLTLVGTLAYKAMTHNTRDRTLGKGTKLVNALPDKVKITVGGFKMEIPLTALDYNAMADYRLNNPMDMVPFTEQERTRITSSKVKETSTKGIFNGLQKELMRPLLNGITTSILLNNTNLTNKEKLARMNFLRWGPHSAPSAVPDVLNQAGKDIIVANDVSSQVEAMSTDDASTNVIVEMDGKTYVVAAELIATIGSKSKHVSSESVDTHSGTTSADAKEEARIQALKEAEGYISDSDETLVIDEEGQTTRRDMITNYVAGLEVLAASDIEIRPLVEGLPVSYKTFNSVLNVANYIPITDVGSRKSIIEEKNKALAELSKFRFIPPTIDVVTSYTAARLNRQANELGFETKTSDEIKDIARGLANDIAPIASSAAYKEQVALELLKELYDIESMSDDIKHKQGINTISDIIRATASAFERFSSLSNNVKTEWNTRLKDLAMAWNDYHNPLIYVAANATGGKQVLNPKVTRRGVVDLDDVSTAEGTFTSKAIRDVDALMAWLRFRKSNPRLGTTRRLDAYGQTVYSSNSPIPWGSPTHQISSMIKLLTPIAMRGASIWSMSEEELNKFDLIPQALEKFSGYGLGGGLSAQAFEMSDVVQSLRNKGVPIDPKLLSSLNLNPKASVNLFVSLDSKMYPQNARRMAIANLVLGSSDRTVEEQKEVIALFRDAGILDRNGNVIGDKALNDFILYGVLKVSANNENSIEKLMSSISASNSKGIYEDGKLNPFYKGSLLGLPVMFIMKGAFTRNAVLSSKYNLGTGTYAKNISSIMHMVEELFIDGFEGVVGEHGLFYHPLLVLKALAPDYSSDLERTRREERDSAFLDKTITVNSRGEVHLDGGSRVKGITKATGKQLYYLMNSIAGVPKATKGIRSHSITSFEDTFSRDSIGGYPLSPQDRAIINKISSERIDSISSESNAFFEAVNMYISAFTDNDRGTLDGIDVGSVSAAIIRENFGDITEMLDVLNAKSPSTINDIMPYGTALEASLGTALPSDWNTADTGLNTGTIESRALNFDDWHASMTVIPGVPANSPVPRSLVRTVWKNNRFKRLAGLITRALPSKFYDMRDELALRVYDTQAEFNKSQEAIQKALDSDQASSMPIYTMTNFHLKVLEEILLDEIFLDNMNADAFRTSMSSVYRKALADSGHTMSEPLIEALVNHIVASRNATDLAVQMKYGVVFGVGGVIRGDYRSDYVDLLANRMLPSGLGMLAADVKGTAWKSSAIRYLSKGVAGDSSVIKQSMDTAVQFLTDFVQKYRANMTPLGSTQSIDIARTPFGRGLIKLIDAYDVNVIPETVASNVIINIMGNSYDTYANLYKKSATDFPGDMWFPIDIMFGGKANIQLYIAHQTKVLNEYLTRSIDLQAAYEAGIIITSEEYGNLPIEEQVNYITINIPGLYDSYFIPASLYASVTKDLSNATMADYALDKELLSTAMAGTVMRVLSSVVSATAVLNINTVLSGMMAVPMALIRDFPAILQIKAGSKAAGLVKSALEGHLILPEDAESAELSKLLLMHMGELGGSSLGVEGAGSVATNRYIRNIINDSLDLSKGDNLRVNISNFLSSLTPIKLWGMVVSLFTAIERRVKIILLISNYKRLKRAEGVSNSNVFRPNLSTQAMDTVLTILPSNPYGTLWGVAQITYASFVNFMVKTAIIATIGPFIAAYHDIMAAGVDVANRIKRLSHTILSALMHYGVFLALAFPVLQEHAMNTFTHQKSPTVNIINNSLSTAGAISRISRVDKDGNVYMTSTELASEPGNLTGQTSVVIDALYDSVIKKSGGTKVDKDDEASIDINDSAMAHSIRNLKEGLLESFSIAPNFDAYKKIPLMLQSVVDAYTNESTSISSMVSKASPMGTLDEDFFMFPKVTGATKEFVDAAQREADRMAIASDGSWASNKEALPKQYYPEMEYLIMQLGPSIIKEEAKGTFTGEDGKLSTAKIVEWAQTNSDVKLIQVKNIKIMHAISALEAEYKLLDPSTISKNDTILYKSAIKLLKGKLITPKVVERLATKYTPWSYPNSSPEASLFRRVLTDIGYDLSRGEVVSLPAQATTGDVFEARTNIPIGRYTDPSTWDSMVFIKIKDHKPLPGPSNTVTYSIHPKGLSIPGLNSLTLIEGYLHDLDTAYTGRRTTMNLSGSMSITTPKDDKGWRDVLHYAYEKANITPAMHFAAASKLEQKYPGSTIVKVNIEEVLKKQIMVDGEWVNVNDKKGNDSCGYKRACAFITYTIQDRNGKRFTIDGSDLTETAGLGVPFRAKKPTGGSN